MLVSIIKKGISAGNLISTLKTYFKPQGPDITPAFVAFISFPG
jgi:hypothetical protein